MWHRGKRLDSQLGGIGLECNSTTTRGAAVRTEWAQCLMCSVSSVNVPQQRKTPSIPVTLPNGPLKDGDGALLTAGIFLFICPPAGSWQGEEQWRVGTRGKGDGGWATGQLRELALQFLRTLLLTKPQRGWKMRGSTYHAPGTALTHLQPPWGVGVIIPIFEIPHRLVKLSNLSTGRT